MLFSALGWVFAQSHTMGAKACGLCADVGILDFDSLQKKPEGRHRCAARALALWYVAVENHLANRVFASFHDRDQTQIAHQLSDYRFFCVAKAAKHL